MRYYQNVLKLCCTIEETMLILGWKCWKFPNLTLTFDLEMTLRVNSQWLFKRYHLYLNIDQIWPKCIEIMLHSGRNNAHFGLKMLKIPKFDLDLWPWNDLDRVFIVESEDPTPSNLFWKYYLNWPWINDTRSKYVLNFIKNPWFWPIFTHFSA